ncbi:probable L-type lectin-domain containing receptor kinase S.7 [Tanacetum coccineum]
MVDWLSFVGIDLKSGNLLTAWIDYWYDDAVFLGFSASTEGSTETHFVENWSFTSFGIQHVKPHIINLHNVLDNAVTKNPGIEVPTDIRNHGKSHKKVRLVVGVLGPVFFCAILFVFGYISVKKLKEGKTEINMQAELLKGPKQFSYKS